MKYHAFHECRTSQDSLFYSCFEASLMPHACFMDDSTFLPNWPSLPMMFRSTCDLSLSLSLSYHITLLAHRWMPFCLLMLTALPDYPCIDHRLLYLPFSLRVRQSSVRWLASKIFIGADRADLPLHPDAHPLDGVTRSNVNSAKMQRIKTTESSDGCQIRRLTKRTLCYSLT